MKSILKMICGLLLTVASAMTAGAGNGHNGTNSRPFAVNLVVNTALCFSAMDNNPAYDEDAVAGQITVSSLSIVTGGSISYNDPGHTCSDAGVPNDGAGNI